MGLLESATPSVLYAAADVEADFGSVPSALTLRIYQISAAVGRGFPVEAQLQETP